MPRSPQVHFRLEPKDDDNKALIYLQFLYNKRRLYFSFGQKIKVGNWSEGKERVKSNKETTEDGKHSLNDLLDNLEKICIKSYTSELKNGIPEPEVLKKYLQDFIDKNKDQPDSNKPTLYKLIDLFVTGKIKYKGRNKSPNTIKTYKTALRHLKEFEHIKKYKVDFETITLDFYYKFVDFLSVREKHKAAINQLWNKKENIKSLGINSIAKDIQVLKVFMLEAVDFGYTNNLQFNHKKFTVSREETDAVYLTEKELNKLYKTDVSNNKRLEQARDLFLFGSFVGLRYSDYSNIKEDNIVNIDGDRFIKLKTQKTKEQVIIPCNRTVLEIFEKYNYNPNNLPKSISNQKLNDYIKEVALLAGLTEKGRLVTHPERELYKCISSHTARRSFATNLYLEGYPTIEIMKITGHKTEKAFMKYIRVTKLDAAKRLSAHMKKTWSEKVLKVA